LNALEVPADAIFCDVVTHSTKYKANQLSEELEALSPEAQKRIIQMVELMIEQEKNNQDDFLQRNYAIYCVVRYFSVTQSTLFFTIHVLYYV
jgi:hypothetical protein